MLERLKKAFYDRQHGPALAELILQVEQEIESLPPGAATKPWIDSLWSLRPEFWLDRVQLLRNQIELTKERENWVKVITRRNKLRWTLEGGDPARSESDVEKLNAAVADVEKMQAEAKAYEERVRNHAVASAERFATISYEAPTDEREGEARTETVPQERHLRDRHDNLKALQSRLLEAIAEKGRLKADGVSWEAVVEAELVILDLGRELCELDIEYRRLTSIPPAPRPIP